MSYLELATSGDAAGRAQTETSELRNKLKKMRMRKMLKAKPEKPLAERIADFRDELDQFIDSRAEEIKAEAPGVPLQVLRNILTNRGGGCQCQAVQNILGGRDVLMEGLTHYPALEGADGALVVLTGVYETT